LVEVPLLNHLSIWRSKILLLETLEVRLRLVWLGGVVPSGRPTLIFQGKKTGENLLRVVEGSFRSGRMVASFNTTFIALILKKYDPKSYKCFPRSIFLCNCIYKVIVKIITNKVKPILSKNISKEQFSFFEDRKIHEAIKVAQEGHKK